MENDALTRENLYRIVADNFKLIDPYLTLKHNRDFIIRVFEDSANLAKKIEADIASNIDYDFVTFNKWCEETVSMLKEQSFKSFVDTTIRKNILQKIVEKKIIEFKAIVFSVFKEMADYHNRIIDACFPKHWFSFDRNPRESLGWPQTFLSYAYFDKGVTLGLYIYFWINGGFLYVNWMWSGVNHNSGTTKGQLDEELQRSHQLLFLRTIHSELRYRGSSQVRQWCSWEIGNFYTKNKTRKYYLDFYDLGKSKNDLLSTFGIFRNVRRGLINQ